MFERSFGARGTDLQSRWLHGNRQGSEVQSAKVSDICLERRFAYHHCDLFGSAHILARMQGTRHRARRARSSFAGSGNQVNASVRRLGRCRAIPVRRLGKTAAGVAYFSRPAITVIAPARNLKGPTCESTSKHEISTPERFKARPIRLQPAHHIMRCCCWQHTRRVSSALPAQ